MATNVATALIGIADIWVIGRLGDAPAQGAVELGARLLMGILFTFNFLRSATTGLTAQAVGQGSEIEKIAALLRASLCALLIGGILLSAKPLIVPLGLDFLKAAGDVRTDAAAYIDIRFWAAPAWLLNAAFIGWLIGLRRMRTVLVIEVAINLIHVGLDALFVLHFDLGVEGIATATLISEILRLLLLATAILPSARAAALWRAAKDPALLKASHMLALFRVNRDLFMRTLILVIAMMLLTRQGAQQGPVILAANAILFQMFMLSALLLDGFENAAQVLCGETVGAKDRAAFVQTTRATLSRGLGVAALLALVFAVAGDAIVGSFSTDAEVTATVQHYAVWLIAIPIAGVASFVFDGVFIGATWTRAMMMTMLFAAIIYGLMLWLTAPLGNHGLWLSFTVFLIVRAAGQALMIPALAARTFGPVSVTT